VEAVGGAEVVGFSIERTSFDVDTVVRDLLFDAPLIALTGETKSGKSTLLEAMWWVVGVEGVKLMPAAAECEALGFTARFGDTKWRITRNPADLKQDIVFTHVTTGVDERHPVKRTQSRRSASDVFQDLMGIPRLGAGRTRVTLELLLPWLYADQRSLSNHYLGGQSKEQRIAVGRVLLGAVDETVDALRQEAANKSKEWNSARNRVKRILRAREERELPSAEDLQQRATQWTAQRQEASERVERSREVLSRRHAELADLQQKATVAEQTRQSVRAAADERERTARLLERSEAEARGRLAGLREAVLDPSLCPRCTQPLDPTGLAPDDCRVCRKHDPKRLQREEESKRRLAEAQQAAERAGEAARRAAQAAEDARARVADADLAFVEASAAVQTFLQDVIAPQQKEVLEAEAAVRELTARLEQNAEHLRELAELTEERARLPQLEREKDAAEAAYAEARHDTDLMVKQGTARWSDHLLRRMQACDPEVTTATISPDDFSVTVNGGAFDSGVVAGHGRIRINITVLLAPGDAARGAPAMPVPQFLIVDGPFTGLGSSPNDQRTQAALLDGLTDLAVSEHPSGTAGQVIIACTELPLAQGGAVREIRTSLAEGAIPGLPPRQATTA